MINEFKLKELNMDMMGYNIVRYSDYSFHHLIVPKRDCKRNKIPSDGYLEWNGAILSIKSSHPYLHVVERYERECFEEITHRLVEINKQGYVDEEHLRLIYNILEDFESMYEKEVSVKGKRIIRPEYRDRIELNNENCEKLEKVREKILTLKRNNDIL